MTIQELYYYCKKKGLTDFNITISNNKSKEREPVSNIFVYLAEKEIEFN